MSKELARRQAIIEAFRAERTVKEVIDFFDYNRDFVYRLKRQYDETEDKDNFFGNRTLHKRRSNTKRDDQFVTDVSQMIQDNPTKSMATIASEMNVARSTISKTITKDLGMKSYTLRKRQLLTEATVLLTELKHGSTGLRSFSDENNFIQDQLFNRQNDRFITDLSPIILMRCIL